MDCAKASGPIETAICASADLKAQDAALGDGYGRLIAAAQARDAGLAAELREGQRQWLRRRDLDCTPFAANPARLASCLASAYRTRLAFLAAAAPLPSDTLPAAPADASASLSRDSASASADEDAILRVEAPGRLSIRAESPTGVALQLVDMIAGPGSIDGEAGLRDGRLDVLVDKGTYKIRSFGSPKAQGRARLSVAPFRSAAPAGVSLSRGGEFSGDLADLQQRSFWLIVDKSGHVLVEAAGRALRDLRLWRNGTDLAELNPALDTIEPKPGHGLTRARLEGAVEPGLYLVTAYGGAPLAWADADTAKPFHIRMGAPEVMAGGFAEGVIGPLGSLRLEVPPPATYMRLELPEPVPATIGVSRGTGSRRIAAIVRNSRDPIAAVLVPESGGTPASVEVTGLEGQFFRLRALRPSSSLRANGSGPHLVAVDVAGEGGDELPATVVLARFDSAGKGSVLTSSAPHIGPGAAWRGKFNLRGASSLIFEVTRPGSLAVVAQGPGVEFRLESLLGVGAAPRADGKLPRRWDVEAGWYYLRIDPVKGAAGILDLTVGPPGLTPNLAPASPPRISIPLGIQDFDKASYYQVYANSGEGLVTAPRAAEIPIDLASAPLTLLQPPRGAADAFPVPPPLPSQGRQPPAAAPLVMKLSASRPFEIPVRVPLGGRITVTEASGVPVAATFTNERPGKSDRTLLVVLPVSDRERTLVIAWTQAAAPIPMPVLSQQRAEPITAGKPYFFDLERDAHRSFRLEVPEGGLYRVETLGRLKTALTLGTAFLPKVAAAQDNGAGHNALLQTYLRAGSYRIDVSASESNGHLGIVASPAALLDAGNLAPEESLRATLAEGRGAVFALAIPESGKYRLDLYGLDRTFTARLEDEEGWPLTVPNALSVLERPFAAARFRLVVLPEPVEARVVARLRRDVDPPALDGHGPHPLAFDAEQKFQWHEPQGKDTPRLPDRWEFSLAGPANVALDLSEGMIGDLLRLDPDPRLIGKISVGRGFSDVLPTGHYALEARALGRNDRLDYQLSLRSKELQPGVARSVDLPARIPFAVASGRVVSLTTFGRTELKGVLRDADGRVIERLTGRTNDWNIALSRRLAAGAYRLDLSAVTAEASAATGDDADQSQAPSDSDEASDKAIEVRLAVPELAEAQPLAFTGSAQIGEARVQQFTLPQAEAGKLVLLAAQATAELVISLERREADGNWRAAGFEQGRAPVIAFPSDGDAARPWRASVWAVDGGAVPITVAARELSEPAQTMGTVALAPFTIEGFAQPVRVALVAVPGAGLVDLSVERSDLRAGSMPGRPLRPSDGGVLAPQSDRLWLVAKAAGPQSVAVAPLAGGASEIALDLASGETATLPKPAVPEGRVRVWTASSTFGQPGLAAGRGTGIAPGSALALAGDAALRVWNAGGEAELRLRLATLDLEMRPPIAGEGTVSLVLPPRSAQPIHLGPGAKHLALDLAPGLGAFAGGGDGHGLAVWTGDAAVSRDADGDWTDLLIVNTGDKEAAASLASTPAQGSAGLATGAVLKRFFGASGSLALAVSAKPGDRLGVGGASATFLAETGAVLRGTDLVLPGPGSLVLDHKAGLVAAWLGNDAVSPWPVAAPAAVTPPQSVKLEGSAMRLSLKQDVPALLHARTSAPVILVLKQGDAKGEPVLFPAGAEYHRYVAAGEAELSLYSPHDGPLGGTLELSATPVTQAAEGLGAPQALAPGATSLFAFEVTRAGKIGVGIRAEPDRAQARLLDSAGRSLGEGVTQFVRLEPGRYFVEVRAPTDGGTLIVRPAIIGLTPPPAGPPPEIAKAYLEMVGLTSRTR